MEGAGGGGFAALEVYRVAHGESTAGYVNHFDACTGKDDVAHHEIRRDKTPSPVAVGRAEVPFQFYVRTGDTAAPGGRGDEDTGTDGITTDLGRRDRTFEVVVGRVTVTLKVNGIPYDRILFQVFVTKGYINTVVVVVVAPGILPFQRELDADDITGHAGSRGLYRPYNADVVTPTADRSKQ